jgi:hypothetical protein
LSSANGSRLFANDRKNIVRILTISLSALAIISAALFAYQQYTKPAVPDLISKDEAIQIALKAGNWNEQTLRDKKIEAILVHVKANGFSFIVDQNSLQDTITIGGKFTEFPDHENQYLWLVDVTAPNNRGWGYTIDAGTGEISRQPFP